MVGCCTAPFYRSFLGSRRTPAGRLRRVKRLLIFALAAAAAVTVVLRPKGDTRSAARSLTVYPDVPTKPAA